MRRTAALLFVAAALGAPATAQSTAIVYAATFAGGLEGWTATPAVGGVGWSADNTPAVAPPSLPNCLNYNDGTDYDNGDFNTGTATSPAINLAGATSATLTFQCYFETEDPFAFAFFDTKRVQLSTDNFATSPVDELLGIAASPVVGECPGALAWHTHTVTLPAALLASGLQIRFTFDTVDSLFNGFQGWFVDDVSISAVGIAPPGGDGGFGPGGASRDNANGDQGFNDLFCSSGAAATGSMIGLAATLAILAAWRASRRA